MLLKEQILEDKTVMLTVSGREEFDMLVATSRLTYDIVFCLFVIFIYFPFWFKERDLPLPLNLDKCKVSPNYIMLRNILI